MTKPPFFELSMRERQIMDVVYELEKASVSDIVERLDLEDNPNYDAVRMTLAVLKKKGYVKASRNGRSYVYVPTERPERARKSALEYLLKTFFKGSAPGVVSTLLGMKAGELSESELAEIEALIKKKRQATKRRTS